MSNIIKLDTIGKIISEQKKQFNIGDYITNDRFECFYLIESVKTVKSGDKEFYKTKIMKYYGSKNQID